MIPTNLWISYLISSKFIKIDLLLKTGKIRLIFSEESLQEFLEVAQRPKLQKYFSEDDIDQLLGLFEHFGELIEVQSKVDICRDPKDNFLLALAKDSRADYLVTGDKDLLEIGVFEQTQILTFASFSNIME